MKNTCFSLLLTLAAGWCLVSCGTTLVMPDSAPAELDMRRGSGVSITGQGQHANLTKDYLIGMIRADGYYRYVSSGYGSYSIDVYDIGGAGVGCVIRRGRDGAELWNTGRVPNSWSDLATGDSLEKIYARRIYQEFVPHETTYKVTVKPDAATQRAVDAARARNWDAAVRLAQQAVQEHPENPEANFLMGVLLRNSSDFNTSDAYIKRAIELDPSESRYREGLQKNASMRSTEQSVISQLRG